MINTRSEVWNRSDVVIKRMTSSVDVSSACRLSDEDTIATFSESSVKHQADRRTTAQFQISPGGRRDATPGSYRLKFGHCCTAITVRWGWCVCVCVCVCERENSSSGGVWGGVGGPQGGGGLLHRG